MNKLIPMRFRGLTSPETSLFDDDFFRPFFAGAGYSPTAFRVDVRDEAENYVIEAELPGLSRDAIRIDVDDGVLTISAEWKSQKKDEDNGGYIINERRSGRVQRSFSLDNVLEDGITADYRDGMLLVTLPKRDEVRRTPRRIELS
jgi:HSP20 family protein